LIDELRKVDPKNELPSLVYRIGDHLFKTPRFDEKYGGSKGGYALEQHYDAVVVDDLLKFKCKKRRKR
jgi:hypothetical protein